MNITNYLTHWYKTNKRDLPWRNTQNPYHIWISEILLQQTRVNQGIEYYKRIIQTFPDVNTLANSDIDSLLKIWQGLGYYSRARNMHKAAKILINQYNSIFPGTFDELKKLPGIGDYTAAAIASFAFNEPVPVVDGNVYRFLARLFGIYTPIDSNKGKKEFYNKSASILSKTNPGLHNQSIMEFGAIQCTPGKPDCSLCVFSSTCYAHAHVVINQLPVKTKKKQSKKRYFHYIFIHSNDFILIEQRDKKDIWNSLYQLPLIETTSQSSLEKLIQLNEWNEILQGHTAKISAKAKEYTHVLTHQKIFARFYFLKMEDTVIKKLTNFKIISKKEINKFAVPRLIDRFFNDNGIA